MSYVQDKFFVVHTSFDRDRIEQARALALDVFAHAPHLVGPIMHGAINDSTGFVVWTSGSKMGWRDADRHDASTEELIARLSQMARPPRWVRVTSGEDRGDLSAEHGSDGDWTHTYDRFEIEAGPVYREDE